MAQTHLQIVNKVLRRLREDEVNSTLDNSYAQLVAEFVADITEEVQEAHVWEQLKHKVTFDFVINQRSYILSRNLTDGGSLRDSVLRPCTYRSTIRMNEEGYYPLAYLYTDDADQLGERLILINDEQRIRLVNVDDGVANDKPFQFSLTNDGDDLYAEFVYRPKVVQKIEMEFYTPPVELESDGTTDAVQVFLPNRVIYLGSLALALNERGEEIGEPGNIAEMRYRKALAAAIEIDHKHNELTNQYDWYRS